MTEPDLRAHPATQAEDPDDPEGAGARLVLWGVVATAVALVHNRLWATPNLAEFAAIAARLGERPFGDEPGADYLLTNLAMPTLARLLGQTDPHEYARLHLFVLLAGLALCVALAQRRHGYRTARTLTVLLAAAPGVTVALQWLGQPDALTYPLGIALALLGPRWALASVGLVLGLTHPEQAVVMVLSATAARAALRLPDERATPRRTTALRDGALDLVVLAAAVGAGRLVTEVYLRVNDIEILRPRTSLIGLGAEAFVDHHLQEPASLLYLLWGSLWLVIAAVGVLLLRSRGHREGLRWAALAAVAVLALLPVGITLDQTRVYAMLTAPVLAAAAVLVVRLPSTRVLATAPAAAALLAITTVVPGGFTAGTSTWSWELPAAEATQFLRDGTHPGPLGEWLMTPFDFVIPVTAQN